MKTDAPLVTVVTAVYNAAEFLSETMDSVLQQNYENIEFILVNDASTDNSIDIINRYNDPRIVVLSNPKNLGAGAARNRGLQIAKGKYIAIMDADDICLPERISKEVNYLEQHPEVDICGAGIETFGNSATVWNPPSEDIDLKKILLTRCCFAHSTVMLRTASFRKYNLYYDPTFKSAQDFELWNRAAKFLTYHSLPEVLVRYRTGHNQISSRRSNEQKENALIIAQRGLSELLGESVILYAKLSEKANSIDQLKNDFKIYSSIPYNKNANTKFTKKDLYEIAQFNINTLVSLNMDWGISLFICYVRYVPLEINGLKWLLKLFYNIIRANN